MSLVTAAQLRGRLLMEEAALAEDWLAFWESITIEPEVWSAPVSADAGFGFWALAVHDGRVVWFDSLREGFAVSGWSRPGEIGALVARETSLAAVLEGAFSA